MAGDAVHPFWWHGLVLLLPMPLAKPQNVLGCCWGVAQWAGLDLGSLTELDRCLDPRVEMLLVPLRQRLLDLMIGVACWQSC